MIDFMKQIKMRVKEFDFFDYCALSALIAGLVIGVYATTLRHP